MKIWGSFCFLAACLFIFVGCDRPGTPAPTLTPYPTQPVAFLPTPTRSPAWPAATATETPPALLPTATATFSPTPVATAIPSPTPTIDRVGPLRLVGRYQPPPWQGSQISMLHNTYAVANGHIYLLSASRFIVVDVQDRSQPVNKAILELPSYNHLLLTDRFALVIATHSTVHTRESTIHIINIDDPSRPEIVSSIEIDSMIYQAVVVADKLYLLTRDLRMDYVMIWSLASPESPELYDTLPGLSGQIIFFGETVYLLSFDSAIIVDDQLGESPSSFTSATSQRILFLEPAYVYRVNNHRLEIWDLAQLRKVPLESTPRADFIVARDGFVYLFRQQQMRGGGYTTLTALDVTDPSAPRVSYTLPLTTTSRPPRFNAAVHGDHFYVAFVKFYIFDLQQPGKPELILPSDFLDQMIPARDFLTNAVYNVAVDEEGYVYVATTPQLLIFAPPGRLDSKFSSTPDSISHRSLPKRHMILSPTDQIAHNDAFFICCHDRPVVAAKHLMYRRPHQPDIAGCLTFHKGREG
jgi:hypothetical protein